MKRPLALAVAALAATLSVGVTAATPGTGVVTTLLAQATFDAISTTQNAGLDAAIQETTFAPGAYSGWHTHPGLTVVLVESGTITLYNHACQGDDHPAGQGFVEQPGQKALARNNTGAPVTVTVVYFDVPVGGGVRSDALAPACADAGEHDLPTTATGSGVTAAILNRVNFATAASIVGAAGRDVVVVRNTLAPGGHSGWHSHTGAAVVTVKSGTLTLYNAASCKAQTFAAGHGWVEEPSDVQIGRNEGTVPLVLYVAFFDVPVGGSNRIDRSEPSNCTGLAAVPTPTPFNGAGEGQRSSHADSVAVYVSIALLFGSVALFVWVLMPRRRHRPE